MEPGEQIGRDVFEAKKMNPEQESPEFEDLFKKFGGNLEAIAEDAMASSDIKDPKQLTLLLRILHRYEDSKRRIH